MPDSIPSNPSTVADASAPAGSPVQTCPAKQSAISGRFKQSEVKCGDTAHVEADGVQITEGSDTRFAISRVRDKASLQDVSASMNAQRLRDVAWRPKRPADHRKGDAYTFVVSADGVSASSSNNFAFKEYPDYAPETQTFNRVSGVFGWTGKFDIKFAADQITVTVKIKLINRLGSKPADAATPQPAIGETVTAEDKAAMKADVEGKISGKVRLYRKGCTYNDACACPKPVSIVVDFVEAGAHHEVNLYQGSGRANATNWTRVKTRDNSWAHETGHLLGWFDEYAGGAVGPAPRWQPDEAANIMNVGLTMPPEYVWDFRDWFAGKSGEEWVAKS